MRSVRARPRWSTRSVTGSDPPRTRSDCSGGATSYWCCAAWGAGAFESGLCSGRALARVGQAVVGRERSVRRAWRSPAKSAPPGRAKPWVGRREIKIRKERLELAADAIICPAAAHGPGSLGRGARRSGSIVDSAMPSSVRLAGMFAANRRVGWHGPCGPCARTTGRGPDGSCQSGPATSVRAWMTRECSISPRSPTRTRTRPAMSGAVRSAVAVRAEAGREAREQRWSSGIAKNSDVIAMSEACANICPCGGRFGPRVKGARAHAGSSA